jgi:hypothetical protein
LDPVEEGEVATALEGAADGGLGFLDPVEEGEVATALEGAADGGLGFLDPVEEEEVDNHDGILGIFFAFFDPDPEGSPPSCWRLSQNIPIRFPQSREKNRRA